MDTKEYPNTYEERRDLLWRTVSDNDDLRYANVINFFVPRGRTSISGKVFTPPPPEFKCECNTRECFTKIKEKMVTKSGQVRKAMLNLPDYEITAWSNLLEYLRFSWQEGEDKVLLTGKEWYMLFGDGSSKKTTKKAAKKKVK